MAGKRIGKWVKVFIDNSVGAAQEITNDVVNIPGLPLNYTEVEVSGYGQDKNYLAGQGDAPIEIDMLFTTTATVGTHTIFKDLVGTNFAVTLDVRYGNNAVATTGDPKFLGEFIVTKYDVTAAKDGAMTSKASLRVAEGNALPSWTTV